MWSITAVRTCSTWLCYISPLSQKHYLICSSRRIVVKTLINSFILQRHCPAILSASNSNTGGLWTVSPLMRPRWKLKLSDSQLRNSKR
jgi:hypothetical protein